MSKYAQEIIKNNNVGKSDDFSVNNKYLKEPRSALPPQIEEFGDNRIGGDNSLKQSCN